MNKIDQIKPSKSINQSDVFLTKASQIGKSSNYNGSVSTANRVQMSEDGKSNYSRVNDKNTIWDNNGGIGDDIFTQGE